MVRPTDVSPALKPWLHQFALDELDLATTFFGSLSYVSASDFEIGMRRMIDSAVKSDAGPLAVFVVRDVNLDSNSFVHYLGDYGDRNHVPVIMPAGEAGSEGRLAHSIKLIVKTYAGELLDHPTLSQMAAAKCRGIIFVDDIIGTGRRMEKFIDHFYAHPTIKSWCSRKYLRRFCALAFAATAAGLERARSSRVPRVEVVAYRAAPTISDVLPKSTGRAFRDLCFKYAKLTGAPRLPLGFGKNGCMLVFSHGCPNVCPPILWATSATWIAPFPHKLVPTTLQFGRGMGVGVAKTYELSEEDRSEALRRNGALTASILQECRRRRDPTSLILRLSIITGLGIRDLDALLESFVGSALLNSDGTLTSDGAIELSRLRAEPAVPQRNSAAYFPTSLRPRSF